MIAPDKWIAISKKAPLETQLAGLMATLKELINFSRTYFEDLNKKEK